MIRFKIGDKVRAVSSYWRGSPYIVCGCSEYSNKHIKSTNKYKFCYSNNPDLHDKNELVLDWSVKDIKKAIISDD